MKNESEENKTNYVRMQDLDKILNEIYMSDDTKKDLGLMKRYLERLVLTIERSRVREFMMLTDSKRRLFIINFLSGLGRGFGQAIGFSVLAAVALYIMASWVDLPIVGKYIAQLLDIVDNYRGR